MDWCGGGGGGGGVVDTSPSLPTPPPPPEPITPAASNPPEPRIKPAPPRFEPATLGPAGHECCTSADRPRVTLSTSSLVMSWRVKRCLRMLPEVENGWRQRGHVVWPRCFFMWEMRLQRWTYLAPHRRQVWGASVETDSGEVI